MTKTERIELLEAQVKALKATITEQAIRIGMLEARPLVMPTVPAVGRYSPPGPFTLQVPQCTCGVLTGICPVHGGQLAIGNTSVAILGVNTGYIG